MIQKGLHIFRATEVTILVYSFKRVKYLIDALVCKELNGTINKSLQKRMLDLTNLLDQTRSRSPFLSMSSSVWPMSWSLTLHDSILTPINAANPNKDLQKKIKVNKQKKIKGFFFKKKKKDYNHV